MPDRTSNNMSTLSERNKNMLITTGQNDDAFLTKDQSSVLIGDPKIYI